MNHKYELHYSDGCRGMFKGNNIQTLIKKVKQNKNIRDWGLFKTGTGFHSTTQTEFLVYYWDRDNNSYLSNIAKKEVELLNKRYTN